MPRYHFNIHNGIGFVADEEGRDLADLGAARAEGIKGARGMIADDVLSGVVDLNGRLDVTDADGKLLLTIPFAEAVEISH
ncbi:MAG TPA: hypothetical protein VEW71_07065 [Allosphingosinicella sp.]|nr:hypothetical protein [Allosphingosinicella sp.]